MAGLSPTIAGLTAASVGRRGRARAWLVGAVVVAITSVLLIGWVVDVATNSSIHNKVQQQVERALSNGIQAAAAGAPLRYVGAERGSYYVPDIFRGQVMTLCVASAVSDDALRVEPGPECTTCQHEFSEYLARRHDRWGGRCRDGAVCGMARPRDLGHLTVPVTLPHYASPHKTVGFPVLLIAQASKSSRSSGSFTGELGNSPRFGGDLPLFSKAGALRLGRAP
jgi:hypothetical protein